MTIPPLGRAKVPTGLSIAIPDKFEGQIRPRSGLAARTGVTVLNSPGTIDADYRGEVLVLLVNLSDAPVTIAPLERIAQLVIAPVARAELIEADPSPRRTAATAATARPERRSHRARPWQHARGRVIGGGDERASAEPVERTAAAALAAQREALVGRPRRRPRSRCDRRNAPGSRRQKVGLTLKGWRLGAAARRRSGLGGIRGDARRPRRRLAGRLRVMIGSLAKNERARSHFVRGAYAASRFQHPRVIAVSGDGTDDDGRTVRGPPVVRRRAARRRSSTRRPR